MSRPTGRNADPRRTLPLTSTAWRKLRAYVLNESPLCEHCLDMGLTTPATDVDHINGDPSDNGMANLASLCHSCHSRKTRREMNGSAGTFGCDANGIPRDPNHPWNAGVQARKSLEADGK